MTNMSIETIRRLTNHYIKYLREQLLLKSKGYQNLVDELPHIMNVLDGCVAHEGWQAVLDLYQPLDFFLLHQREWENRIHASEAALLAAEGLHQRDTYYLILEKLGATYHQLNQLDYSKQYYKQALDLAQANHDYVVVRRIKENIGDDSKSEVDLDAAIKQCEKNLILAQEKNSQLDIAYYLHELATIYQHRKELDLAFNYLSRALKMAIKAGDVFRTSKVLESVGDIYLLEKQFNQAISGYQFGLEIALENHLDISASWLFYGLGYAYDSIKESEKAVENYRKAIRLNPHEPTFYNLLGDLYLRIGKIEQAKHCLILRRDKRPFDALSANVRLGIISLLEKKPEIAQDYFQTALGVGKITAIRKIQTEGTLLSNIAMALLGVGETKEAIDTAKQAVLESEPEDMAFEYYDLLEKAQVAPSGLTEMRRLFEEKVQQANLTMVSLATQ